MTVQTPSTVTTPFGRTVVDADGNPLSHVFGAGVDQGAAPLRTETIGENLAAIVEKFGDRECIVDTYSDVRLTYDEFHDRVLRVASALHRDGFQAGDRIGIWSTNRWEWPVVEYACHYLGLILVNLNPAYRQSELNYVLEKAGVRCIFAARRYKTSEYRTMLNEARKQRGVRLNRVVYFGSDEWKEYIGGEKLDLSELAAEVKADDPVNIQFTSGTTGFPKGATLTHRNILNNAYMTSELLGLTEKDRVCVPVPYFHTFGMVLGVMATISRGACLVVAGPTFNPRETLMAVHTEKATALYGVPTMFIAMLEDLHDHDEYGGAYDLSSLRTGIMGGTSCPSKTMREVMDKMNMTEVAICYGMTETSPCSVQTRKDSPLDKRVNTVGLVGPHLEVAIVDADGNAVPRGQQGEIVVRGYSVMQGYWRHPEKTSEAIDADGWMHTEDLGVMDEDGYIAVTGRIKDMLIRGGENISPREIEEFLFTHPAVVDAQVIGVPDDRYGEEIMAWVILHDGYDDLTAEDVAEFGHGKIARYKLPRYVHVTDSYPTTASGKVRKVELREMAPRVLGWV